MKTSKQIIDEAVKEIGKARIDDGHFEETGEYDEEKLRNIFRQKLEEAMRQAVNKIINIQDCEISVNESWFRRLLDISKMVETTKDGHRREIALTMLLGYISSIETIISLSKK